MTDTTSEKAKAKPQAGIIVHHRNRLCLPHFHACTVADEPMVTWPVPSSGLNCCGASSSRQRSLHSKLNGFSAARFCRAVFLQVLSFRGAGWGTQACLLRFAVPGGQPLGGYDRTAPTGLSGLRTRCPGLVRLAPYPGGQVSRCSC